MAGAAAVATPAPAGPAVPPASAQTLPPVDGEDDDPQPSRRRRFGPSLELNAIALMAATGITALVGLGFWAIAARLPPAEVGRSSAIISTATMLSQIAASNVGMLFGRVLASAGEKSRKVVLAGYGAALTVALALSIGFLVFFPHPELFPTWVDAAGFPVLVLLLSLSTLQDWVLIGLRSSSWVPVVQLLFALGKMGLLIAFSAVALQNGILLAWALPVLLIALVINPILFFRKLANRPPPGEGTPPMPGRRELQSIFFAEYAAGAVTVIIPLVLPLLVVARLGTEANAYFALPWLVAESFAVLIWNISSSYVVEASHDRRQQVTLMWRTLRLSYLVGGIGVPALFFLAPWLLALLGSNYAEEGTAVLRWAVLAIPFSIITTLFINTSRVRNQMGRVVALELLTAALVIGLAVVLLDRIGIAGAALSYLVAQGLSAVVVIVPLVRFMRGNRASLPRGSETEPEPPTEPFVVVSATTGPGQRMP